MSNVRSHENRMPSPRVFIDTNVLKFSATELTRLRPRVARDNWGGKEIEIVVHDIVSVNPNDLITNASLKSEADLLPQLAELGTRGSVKYFMHFETKMESWGLRNMDSAGGPFYGAPIELVEGPFKYGRIVGGGGVKPRQRQFQFLKSLRYPRFTELQRLTGAYQGKLDPNRNQLLDAFHLWCAEHAQVDYFLTLDFKLIDVMNRSRSRYSVRLVRPSELLSALHAE
jgi:hypothetical protein